MLVVVGTAVGFCAVVEDITGPLQVNTLAPPVGFAEIVTVPPRQIWPLLDGAADGVGLTVTCVV